MIRYLADEEDDLFLTNLREKIKTLNSKQNLGILLIFQKVSPTSEFTLIFWGFAKLYDADLSLETFEQIMESLERSTAFDVIVSLNRAEVSHLLTLTWLLKHIS